MTDRIEAVQSKQADKGESQITGNHSESSSRAEASKNLLEDFKPNTIGGMGGDSMLDNNHDSMQKGSSDLPNITIEKGKKSDQSSINEDGDKVIFDAEKGINNSRNGESSISGEYEIDENMYESLEYLQEVEPSDRREAKETLAKEISDLIPEQDRKTLESMQSALVDGDLKAFSKAINDVSGDPEKLELLVKELNKQLKENEKFGGVDVHFHKGSVILHKHQGDTALKIDPKSQEATLHPMKVMPDRSVVLTEGEIINKQPDEVMQSIGDAATLSINCKFIQKGGPHIINNKFSGKPLPSFINPKDNYYQGRGGPMRKNFGQGSDMSGQKDSFIRGFTDTTRDMIRGLDSLMNNGG